MDIRGEETVRGINILAAISLLAVGLHAQPVPNQLDSLKVGLFYQLAAPATGDRFLTSAVATWAINIAYAQTCIDYPANEKFDTLVFSRDSQGVALATDYNRIKDVFRKVSDSVRIRINPLPKDSLDIILDTYAKNVDKKGDKMTPGYWYTFGKRLLLIPKFWGKKASSVDTIYVEYFAVGPRLTSASDSLTFTDNSYINKVLDYAAAKLSGARNNFEDANFYMSLYERGLREPLPRKVRKTN